MPNWTDTSMSVVLPTRNVDKFKSYFLGNNEEENKAKKLFFRRTWIHNCDEEKNDKGISCLHIDCQCAWSVGTCMIDGEKEPDADGSRCVSLHEVCKDCDVLRLTILSNEPGVGFDESVTYNRDEDDEVHYSSRDSYPDPWNEFIDEDEADEAMEMN